MSKLPDGRYVDDAPFDPEASIQQLERADLDAPNWVRAHEPFELQLSLHSRQAARADLLLLRNGVVLSQTALELSAGSNRLSLVDQVEASGLYEYEAIVNSPADGEQANNRYQTFVQVRGEPRVLHVIGRQVLADQNSITFSDNHCIVRSIGNAWNFKPTFVISFCNQTCPSPAGRYKSDRCRCDWFATGICQRASDGV